MFEIDLAPHQLGDLALARASHRQKTQAIDADDAGAFHFEFGQDTPKLPQTIKAEIHLIALVTIALDAAHRTEGDEIAVNGEGEDRTEQANRGLAQSLQDMKPRKGRSSLISFREGA